MSDAVAYRQRVRHFICSLIPEKLASVWRGLIVTAVTLACYAASVATALMLSHGSQGSGLIALPIFFVDLYLCIAIHELGHTAAARLVGWRVHIITVGRYSYFPAENRFARVLSSRRREYGGWVFATPPVTASWEKGRTLFILGGPIANILVAAGSLAFAITFDSQFWSPVIGCFSVISLILGIGNLIPFWGPGLRRSDGARLFYSARETDQAGAMRHLHWLHAMWLDGVRPIYWDADLVREVARYEGAEQDNRLRDVMLVNYYFGFGDVLRARAVIERHIRTTKTPSPALMIEHVFLTARMDGNAPGAQNILDEVPQNVRETFQYWRALAAVRSVTGDSAGARAAVAAALAVAVRTKASPDQDDQALFSAIERGQPLPKLVPRVAPA